MIVLRAGRAYFVFLYKRDGLRGENRQFLGHFSRWIALDRPNIAFCGLATKREPLRPVLDAKIDVMITFADLLMQRTVRELGLIARAHGLPFCNRVRRAQIEQTLHSQMQAARALEQSFKCLPAEARAALAALHRQGGVCARAAFRQRYGIIRAYRPWVRKTNPWQAPVSIAELLWVKGFIQPQRGGVHLCAEVAALLPNKEQLSQPAEAGLTNSSQAALAPGTALLHDLVVWLGVLLGSSPRVRYDRWLPIAWLQAVDERLLARDPGLAQSRSELQMSRLPFLHYLAEVSGAVTTVQGRLTVTQAAWSWLDLAPAAQLAALRRAVGTDLSTRDPLWDRYRLPARGSHARRQFLSQLKGIPPAMTHAILHVGDGELRLSLPPLPPACAYAQLSAWARADEQSLLINADCARASRLSLPQITDQIARFTGEPLPRPAFDHLAAWLNATSDLRIEQTTLLTTSNPAVLDQLTADRRLRPHLSARLSPHHLTIRPESAAILRRRLAKRGVITTSSTTNPTHSETKCREEACLVRSSDSPSLYTERGAGGEVYLALRFTQEIARAAALPLHIPGALSDTYRASLSDEDILALETRVRTLVDAVRAALSERPQVDVPVAPAQDDPIAIRAAVERAFAHRQPLNVEYYSPWQGTITQRHITPLVEIRWEGDIGYIEAWCGLDHAERTFRLDRILHLL